MTQTNNKPAFDFATVLDNPPGEAALSLCDICDETADVVNRYAYYASEHLENKLSQVIVIRKDLTDAELIDAWPDTIIKVIGDYCKPCATDLFGGDPNASHQLG